MTIESVTYIDDLNANYPEANSNVSEGDDHIRNLKTAIKATFPNVANPVDCIVQSVYVDSAAYQTGTVVLPLDNTTPQNTEGDEYETVTITPKSATNKLIIECEALLTTTASGNWMTMALFQDSTADALRASAAYTPTANSGTWVTLRYEMTAGTTSSTTFKIRAGGNAAGTTGWGGAGGGLFNSNLGQFLKVTEVTSA